MKSLTRIVLVTTLIAVALILIIAGWYLIGQSQNYGKNRVVPGPEELTALASPGSDTSSKGATPSSADLTANWNVYIPQESANLRSVSLTLKYPPDWVQYQTGEGCGPIFGPKARSNSDNLPVYPDFILCLGDNQSSEVDAQELTSSHPSWLVSVARGEVDGHHFVKVRMNPEDPRDESVYTVFVDTGARDPRYQAIVFYTYFDESLYRKYGAQTNYSLQEFISTIDEIVSTLSFEH